MTIIQYGGLTHPPKMTKPQNIFVKKYVHLAVAFAGHPELYDVCGTAPAIEARRVGTLCGDRSCPHVDVQERTAPDHR